MCGTRQVTTVPITGGAQNQDDKTLDKGTSNYAALSEISVLSYDTVCAVTIHKIKMTSDADRQYTLLLEALGEATAWWPETTYSQFKGIYSNLLEYI